MKLTTLYYRSIVPIITLLFLAVIICSYFLVRQTLQSELDSILLRSKSRIEDYIKQQDQLPEISTFNDQQIRFTPIASLHPTLISDTTQYIPEQQKNHVSRKLTFSLLLKGQPYEVTISQPLEGTRHLTNLIVEIAVAAVSLTLFVFVLINRSVLRKIWRPFYRSLELIRSFRVDEPGRTQYPDTAVEEFKLMNAHFLKAAENANRDYRNLKEFSENASHELQTPLAIIRSNLDLLAQENMSERQFELMQGVYDAVRRMSRLQKSLLLLTKIDNRQFTQVDEIRLDLLLQDRHQQLQDMLSERGIHCSLDLEPVSIPANRELTDVLLNNLLSNAIRHNNDQGEINVRLRQNILCISNTGKNSTLDTSRIFRRFYKDSGLHDSNGLGLSIIKQICDTTAMHIQYGFAEGWHSFTIDWTSGN